MNSTAEKAATAPQINCTVGMEICSMRMGINTMPRGVPIRFASVTSLAAVARSLIEN